MSWGERVFCFVMDLGFEMLRGRDGLRDGFYWVEPNMFGKAQIFDPAQACVFMYFFFFLICL